MMLPDWLDKEAWEAWVEVRKKIRAPLTERAAKMWLEDLAEWHEQGYDTRYILRESAKKDWRGLFVNERTPIKAARADARGGLLDGNVVLSASDVQFRNKLYAEHPEIKPADWDERVRAKGWLT